MKLIFSVLVTLLSLPAWAGDFYVLDLNDAHMGNNTGDSVIELRQEMRRQYPQVRLQRMDLLSVMMVSKTRAGNGTARLKVGQDFSKPQKVDGRPGAFGSDDEKSYDRTLMINETGDSNGVWQVHLKGNFKIRQIVVELGDDDRPVRATLDYNDLHIQGGPLGGEQILALRQKAQQELGLNTQQYKIISATLVAKSRAGQGKASFKVGSAESPEQKIPGRPADFQNNSDWSYSTLDFSNPSVFSNGNDNGAWQIHLRGNIKVKEVILILEKK
ncbi:MAG: hypothetical protein KDD33_06670 [Bdellovibrionales bacterium]|nr:hypothetical protein [Bdellovibrionales bacterium]